MKRSRSIGVAAVFVFIIIAIVLAAALDILVFFPNRPALGTGAVYELEIPKGSGPQKLAERICDAGLSSSPKRLALWLRISGKASSVKAGIFELEDNLSPIEIIEKLSFGRPVESGVKILIPEGFTLSKIAKVLEDASVVSAEEFLAAATDPELVKKHGFSSDTFEGLLFPDTYRFVTGITANRVIRTMTSNFKRRIRSAKIPEDEELLKTVTLASIVQAEARLEREMSIIAGVYKNRLQNSAHPSRLLQADPTVSYGCEPHVRPKPASCDTFKGILGRKQLDDSSNPYNTYKHPGLPPGPIGAPGLKALIAAHNPKEVPYLYFVVNSTKDGSHVFSSTYEEHLKAVKKYRNGNN